VWLDVHDETIQVEDDPETQEEFAATYDFLACGLRSISIWDYGFGTLPLEGLMVDGHGDDIKAELEHRNQWRRGSTAPARTDAP